MLGAFRYINPVTAPVLTRLQIVPQVIDGLLPETDVSFSVRYKTHLVNVGNHVPLAETEVPPQLVHYIANPDELHALVMLCPDVQQKVSASNFCHWAVANIPGSNVLKGDVLAPYVPCFANSADADRTRYVFALFRQPHRLLTPEAAQMFSTTQARSNFDLRAWASKHQLGLPLACDFFSTK